MKTAEIHPLACRCRACHPLHIRATRWTVTLALLLPLALLCIALALALGFRKSAG